MRILIAGYGSIGKRHLANVRKILPSARIALLLRRPFADGEQQSTGEVEIQYSIEGVLRFKPQAAIIATPSACHTELAKRLVDAGCHLLIEKPIAASREGVAEMLESAAGRGLVVLVGYNLVFTSAMIAFEKFLATGRVGTIFAVRSEVGQYLPDWRPGTNYRTSASASAKLGGGALLELSHEIHYLIKLFGSIEKVHATIVNTGQLGIDVEDLVLLNVVFQTGCLASVQLDLLQRTYSRSCRVMGQQGTAVWDAGKNTVRFHSPGDKVGEAVFEATSFDLNESYLAELTHFLACIHAGAPPIVNGWTGLEVLNIVAAARESSENGKTVYI
jgi:predicted dehydrogenase